MAAQIRAGTSHPRHLPDDLTASDPPGDGEVHLRPLDRRQTDDHRDELVDLYVESYPPTPGEEFQRREMFLARLEADARRPGFTMLIAETANPVGCVYGYPVERDGSWWPHLKGGLPPDIEQLTATGQVFAVADLMVHPRHRRQGIGRTLHDQLLADQEATLGALLVEQANVDGLTTCHSWGRQNVGETGTTETGVVSDSAAPASEVSVGSGPRFP